MPKKNSLPKNSLPIANDCFGCGVCCLHMGFPAYIVPNAEKGIDGESYWHELPDDLRSEVQSQMDAYVKPPDGELDGPCIWLNRETMLCSHHEHRPRVCRDFEIGNKLCQEWREHYRERIEKA